MRSTTESNPVCAVPDGSTRGVSGQQCDTLIFAGVLNLLGLFVVIQLRLLA